MEVGQEEAAIDLTMMTEYGRSITEVTEVVRNTLTNRVENLVGLQVKELNIRIVNVFFPEQGQDQGRDLDQEQSQQRQEGGSQQ